MRADCADMQPIRVLVADSTRMGAQLLSNALERDGRCKVVDPVVTSAEALQAVATHQIDIALVSSDLDQVPSKAFDTVREFRFLCPTLRSVILLDCSRRELVVAAFRAGAKGVFCRDESLERLARCIRCVHTGQVWASSEQVNHALEALVTGTAPQILDATDSPLLSRREQDVVHYVAEGCSNREIAERLKLSEHTVKNYLFRIFEKLGLSSRVELALYVFAQQQSSTISGNEAAGWATIDFQAPSMGFAIKTAEEGLQAAQHLLAEMYRTGNAVPRDLAQAYVWFDHVEKAYAVLSAHSRVIRAELALKLPTEKLPQIKGRTSLRQRKPANGEGTEKAELARQTTSAA